MRGKPLQLVYRDDGCIVSISHKLDKYGYLILRDEHYKGKGAMPRIKAHRLMYEECVGAIPEGYDVHHTCHNRACVNINHLVLIKKSEHTALHNSARHADKMKAAKEYWERTKCSGADIARKFGVAFSTGSKWVGQWKCRD